MSARGDGKITCLVPVYECADRLADHLRTVRALEEICDAILWVVTPGVDDSVRMVQNELGARGGQYLEVPRGLYEAWNLGISQVTTEFIYISTVGDAVATDGLALLRACLQETGADVCFSPPFLPEEKKARRQLRHWPVFRFRKELEAREGKILPPWMVAKLQALSGIHSLLGSCASCLFRTSFLQSHPFPAGYFHYGDSAWVYQNQAVARLVFLPQAVAKFSVHGPSGRTVEPRGVERLRWMVIRRLALQSRGKAAAQALRRMSACIRYLDANRGRRPARYWWLRPKLLAVRLQKVLQKRLFAARIGRLIPAGKP